MWYPKWTLFLNFIKMPLLLPKFTHFFFCVNSLNHSLGQSNKENIDNSEVQSMTLKKTKYLGTNITR